MDNINNAFTADFETILDGNYCRVWSWAIASIAQEKVIARGINIYSFLRQCYNLTKPTIYFHNLKFDGYYLMYLLLEYGFKPVSGNTPKEDGTFTALITRNLTYYRIMVRFNGGQIVTFCDSLKIIMLPVKTIAKIYKLPVQKGEIDYKKYRPIGYEPDEKEWEYQDNDVLIMAHALKVVFEEGLTKLTMGSNSLNDAIRTCFKKHKDYREFYPVLDETVDSVIREAYFGGWVYVNPKYKGKYIGKGMVYDVNSMYPARVSNDFLPYGLPVEFEGKPEFKTSYPYYIVMITVSWELKKGHFPTQRIKHNIGYKTRDYYNVAHMITIAVTNFDLELLYKHYNITYIEYHRGYYFKVAKGHFKPFIDKWMKQKEVDTGGKRDIDKRMMNGFTGKMATRMSSIPAVPYIDEDKIMKFKPGDEDIITPQYTAYTVFITSICRYNISEIAQSLGDRFVYTDTDSVHILGWEYAKELDGKIHESKLGYYKLEEKFVMAKYLRPKCYIEKIADGKGGYKYNIRVSGLRENAYKYVNMANFKIGFSVDDVGLETKRYIGGIDLQGKPFSIRKNDTSLFG